MWEDGRILDLWEKALSHSFAVSSSKRKFSDSKMSELKREAAILAAHQGLFGKASRILQILLKLWKL